MAQVFFKLLNMSLTALPLIAAAVIFRLAFRRAPKWARCLMWGLVGLRLILPFTFESPVGVIPDPEPVKIVVRAPAASYDGYVSTPALQTNLSVRASASGIAIPEAQTAPGAALPSVTYPDNTAEEQSGDALSSAASVASVVWAVGAAVMLLYALASFIRVRFRVRFALRVEGRVMECEEIDTPFILGVLRPRIYIPYGLDRGDARYVIAHEKSHIVRRDNLWKPLGFVLLAVYWFNPAMWAAYVFLCRDIELACDERVIRLMGENAKAAYSRALVNCSMPRRTISACPLAFGELAVKERVKSVLSYKKPTLWVLIVAILATSISAAFLMTTRASKEPVEEDIQAEEAAEKDADDTFSAEPDEEPGDEIIESVTVDRIDGESDRKPFENGSLENKVERKAAEKAARLEAERKAAEEAARLEAERKAEEAARLEAERKAAEEAARLEAERKAAEEAARLEAERLEAARLEEEARAAEELALYMEGLEAERQRWYSMFGNNYYRTGGNVVIIVGGPFQG